MSLVDNLDDEAAKILIKIENELLNEDRGEKPSMETSVWKGHVMQLSFPANIVEFAYNSWKPRNKDVLIISFPKTGTTWMREILRQILYLRNRKELEVSKHLSIHLQYLEMGPVDKFKVLDAVPLERRVIATHTTPKTLNLSSFNKNKIIYCYRNPRDQIVSLFHHFKKNYPRPTVHEGVVISRVWEEFFQQNLKGEIAIGLKTNEGYIDHLQQWSKIINQNKNILPVSYEDLIKNFQEEIIQISKHVGVELNKDEVMQIEHTCSINNMRKESTDQGITIDEKLRTKWSLVRQGGIGQWREYFTGDQITQLNEKIHRDLKTDIYNFQYD